MRCLSFVVYTKKMLGGSQREIGAKQYRNRIGVNIITDPEILETCVIKLIKM